MRPAIIFTITFCCLSTFFSSGCENSDFSWKWESLETIGNPVARHECGFVAFRDKLYLIGGRRINPVSVFDPATNKWEDKTQSPIEIHHFQAVAYKDAIYIIGAMTGGWPDEKPLGRILKYYPEKDEFVYGDSIPQNRRRGGAGCVVFDGKFYLVGGITHGHQAGFKPWLDEYDPESGAWKALEDAPMARDHFHAVVNQGKLYAFGGRNTSHLTGEDMDLTIEYGNVYDFSSGKWDTTRHKLAIPTQRAGCFAISWKDEIIIGGGESMAHVEAHDEVEGYNIKEGLWSKWPSLEKGRHGTGFAIVGDYVYTASGCGNRGGEPELIEIERLKLPKRSPEPLKTTRIGLNEKWEKDFRRELFGKQMSYYDQNMGELEVFKKWHTITLDFEGPALSEAGANNPFTDYSLQVGLVNTNSKTSTLKNYQGFFAADGNAAETGADSGKVWRIRFVPDSVGLWYYKAILINHKSDEKIPLSNRVGCFYVTESDKEVPDLRKYGKLTVHQTYFKHKQVNKYLLKVGANSPENLLAFKDFDGTYRLSQEARKGEAAASGEIHSYAAHVQDWKEGDPLWQGKKGKGLIGAVNYLAGKGMNSCYFLSMNISGDGKDVWPYRNPRDFTRFDVSKLEQWEIVFEHMQSKGIMIHMVFQETENETLLDSGNTGFYRQIYLKEMIRRFGHHPGIIWNLGEENGPASWTPIAQNDRQRKEMLSFIKETDPYKNPVLLHTHSYDPPRKSVLDSIMGFELLDGLSFQQDKRELAAEAIAAWKKDSKDAGKPWLISMDEIGMWHTGANTDEKEPEHYSLIGDVLWGSLLAGAGGVEWYFGANVPHNDLNSEDWRQRDRLWELTAHARNFFERHLPFWEMEADYALLNPGKGRCEGSKGKFYVLYLPKFNQAAIDLSREGGVWELFWYDPWKGGGLQKGSIHELVGGRKENLGNAPYDRGKDWVAIIKKKP
ncbi:MAG: DUF5060 domain-containing protein [Bacteroidia bacterium]|nr:DUF5060 domain-containing protein [Bacteroidia bacterium]